jgi:hypothetical protein
MSFQLPLCGEFNTHVDVLMGIEYGIQGFYAPTYCHAYASSYAQYKASFDPSGTFDPINAL